MGRNPLLAMDRRRLPAAVSVFIALPVAFIAAGCVSTNVAGYHRQETTASGVEERWAFRPATERLAVGGPGIGCVDVLILRGERIVIRSSVPLPQRRAEACQTWPVDFSARTISRLGYRRSQDVSCGFLPCLFNIERRHYILIGWTEPSGAERVLRLGRIDAHEALLRALSELSGVTISASRGDAGTLARDLPVTEGESGLGPQDHRNQLQTSAPPAH
jgi:hypothetical protein